jgi:hypothetical protein
MRILVLLAFCLQAYSAVQGDPLPAQPGPLPLGWLALDEHELADEPDNDLIATWRTGFAIQGIYVGAEMAMEACKPPNVRQDVLTIDVGQNVVHTDNTDLVVALGFRYYGNLHGQPLQNDFHRAIGNDTWDAQYASDSSQTPMAVVSYRHRSGYDQPFHLYQACTVAVVSRQCDADGQAGVYYTHGRLRTWLGLGLGHTTGGYYGTADRLVQQHFDMLSLRLGVAWHGLEYSAMLGTRGGLGTCGLAW